MRMRFEELDQTTRDFMLKEFDTEEAGGNPYRSPLLSPTALRDYPRVMREALALGTEIEVQERFAMRHHWIATQAVETKHGVQYRDVNSVQAAERLGLGEFNTWYVRGLAARLIAEGEVDCQIYRASQPKWEHASCSAHEGRVYPVRQIYDGHRLGYWPPGRSVQGLSIPAGPGCHHTIRRVRVADRVPPMSVTPAP